MKNVLALLFVLLIAGNCRADSAVAQDNFGHYGYFVGPNVELQIHKAMEFCQRCNQWQGHSWIVASAHGQGWGAIAQFNGPDGRTLYAAKLNQGNEGVAREQARDIAFRRGGNSVHIIQTFYDAGEH